MTLQTTNPSQKDQKIEKAAVPISESNIIVGVPCYNEEKTIAKLIVQLRSIASKIIVCDDGSSDLTGEIARFMGCEVITHPRNLGKGAALRSLFLAARNHKPDVFVTLDGDGQHNALDLAKLILPVLNKECDIAIGSRFEDRDSQSEMPGYRKFGSKMINSVVRKASNLSVKDTQSGYRAYSLDAITKITPGEFGMAGDTEILDQAREEDLSIREFATKISYDPSLRTSKKDPFSHSMEVLASTLKFASLRHPLIFYGLPSLAFFFVSLILGIYSGAFYATNGRLPFGPALVAVSSFIVSALLGAVAVILFSLTTIIRSQA